MPQNNSLIIGLAVVVVIVYFYMTQSSSSSAPTVTPTSTDSSGGKTSLFDTSGTKFTDTVLELYPGKNYAGWDASGQSTTVDISQQDAAWAAQDINSKSIVFAQQRKGTGIKWLFQSIRVKPGTILEITGQIPAGTGSTYYPEVGFIVAKANIPDLTSITKVYPTLQGITFNATVPDNSWTWAMTGTSLFNYSTSSLDMDYSITVVDAAQAQMDAKALYSSCYGMAVNSYQYPADRAVLTCALPDPIGSLTLTGVPTINTASKYVTPGILPQATAPPSSMSLTTGST